MNDSSFSPPVRRALLSVSNKLGLSGFARSLADLGIELYSTGGTARHLAQEGIPVRAVSEYTGFPEMMGGRVKTLHPRVFGGILCRHDDPDDMASLRGAGGEPFELVVVNLYPFEATVHREETTWEEAIEQIDIGGPSLIRAAAKNHAFVTVVTRPDQYSAVLEQLSEQEHTTPELRRQLAGEAFSRTAAYDLAIVDYFNRFEEEPDFPKTLSCTFTRKARLRYGENPHQQAAVYSDVSQHGVSLLAARQLNGKELSYNNYLDLDASLAAVRSFQEPAAVVVKHTNPCGAAVSERLVEAARRAFEGDPVSAFGSIVGFNRTVDEETAAFLAEPGKFIEAIVAPDFSAAAVGILTTRPKWKQNVRLLQVGRLTDPPTRRDMRRIEGGVLVQTADVDPDRFSEWRLATSGSADPALEPDLQFTWNIVRHLKSNAIAVGKDEALWGAGAGQMSRVDAVEIALKKAGERAQGAVLASDAFFPFPDSIERAAEAGIAAIVQPGGSRRDEDVIAACQERGIPMWFTGKRHFRH